MRSNTGNQTPVMKPNFGAFNIKKKSPTQTTKNTAPLPPLSDEVLYLIFLEVFSQEPRPRRKDIRAQAPWNVSAVCKDWRRVALSSPRLWTRFDIGHPPECKKQACFNKTNAIRCLHQLHRSQALPISVDLYAMRCRCAESMVRLLAGHAERWESLALQRKINHTTYEQEYFKSVTPSKLHFSSLRHLEFHGQKPDRKLCLGHHFDQSCLPQLTSVQFVGWAGGEDRHVGFALQQPPEAQFPWARLQHVHLRDYRGGGNSILDFLSSSPALASFRISIPISSCGNSGHTKLDTQRHPSNSVVLNHLVHLDIEVSASIGRGLCQCPIEILPCIRTPKLHELILCGVRSSYLWHGESNARIAGWLTRSQCKIRKLKLWSTWGPLDDDDPYPSFLKAFSSVEELHFMQALEHDTEDGCKALLHHMVRTDDAAAELFPSLKRFHLGLRRFDAAILLQVIQSRNGKLWPRRSDSTVTLERVEVDFRGKVGDYDPSSEEFAEDAVSYNTALLETGLSLCDMPPSFTLTFDHREFRSFDRLEGEFEGRLDSHESDSDDE